MLGMIGGRRKRGATEDETVGWHHQLNGHEFEQAPGEGERQESLPCCSPWGLQRGRHDSVTEQQQHLGVTIAAWALSRV